MAKKPAKKQVKKAAPKKSAPKKSAPKTVKKAAKKPAKKPARKPTPKATKKAPKATTKAPKAAPKAKAPKAAPKPPAPAGDVLPTAAEEARFWSLLEDAWATQSPAVNAARLALGTRELGSDAHAEIVDDALEAVLENLRSVFAFADYPREELVAMDRVLERKLYDIDREDVQAITDGSDDGFLYARGYVVALGKAFYDAVNANPAMAVGDNECEEMCYLPAHVYEQRFGEFPETGSNISRESCMNPAGWPAMSDSDAG